MAVRGAEIAELRLQYRDMAQGVVEAFLVGAVKLADAARVLIHQALQAFLHFDGADALLVTGKQRGVYSFHFLLNLGLIKGR